MGRLAVFVTLLQTVITALAAYDRLDPLAFVLLIVSGLTIAVSRRGPGIALTIVTAATVLWAVRGYPGAPTIAALAVVLVVAAAKDAWKVTSPVALVAYIVWLSVTDPPVGRAIGVGVGTFVTLIFSGIAVEIGRQIRKMFREQRRLHEERRRRQASEERLRIAQELHDVLGHHLSLINMRARVGLHLMDRQPEQARAALTTINMASSEALREVRSVLDALYPAGEAPPKAPAPGLAQLESLTDDAGLPVTTVVDGDPREVPAEIDRAAYRIVQEALTNVRRHAGPGATATVTIGYGEDAGTIEVSDDGGTASPITAPGGEGTGVSGMRERATTLGGSLTAGPRPGGGWRVQAELPAPVPDGSNVPGGTA